MGIAAAAWWGFAGAALLLTINELKQLRDMHASASTTGGKPMTWAEVGAYYSQPLFILGTVLRLGIGAAIPALLASGDLVCSGYVAAATGAAADAFLLDGIFATLWPPVRSS